MFKNNMGLEKCINISITRVIQFVCNPVENYRTTSQQNEV